METDPGRMAAMLVGFPQARVLEVVEDVSGLHVDLETAVDAAVCVLCGQPAVVAGSVLVTGDSGEIGGRPTVLSGRAGGWRRSRLDAELWWSVRCDGGE